ncbi:MAG: DUF3795 domain-containing protein [Paludibacter sp.]|nr:DUF3795 domain-containing protein [Paludibacter sp.]
MDARTIAPCGMNCGICLAYLRTRNTCGGCWGDNKQKIGHCSACVIKNCDFLEQTDSKFCYECSKYPCLRLKQLDKRYRLKYHMSMIENLETIKNSGLDRFLEMEHDRWLCPDCGGTVCVHRGFCLKCRETASKPN